MADGEKIDGSQNAEYDDRDQEKITAVFNFS
jgi:hypothetical protein